MFIADDANPPNGWNMLYGAGLADTYIFNLVPFFLQAEQLAERERVESVIGSHMSFDQNPMNLVSGTIGSARIIREQRLFYQNVIEAVEKARLNGIPDQNIPDHLIKQKVLTGKIIGYDVTKMKVLYKRITNFLITGE